MRTKNFPLGLTMRSPRDFRECAFGEVEGIKVKLLWLKSRGGVGCRGRLDKQHSLGLNILVSSFPSLPTLAQL